MRARAREGFEEFWSRYPKSTKRAAAEAAWSQIDPAPEAVSEILAGLERWKRSEGWRTDEGRYVPKAVDWLEGRQWETEPYRPRDEDSSVFIVDGERIRIPPNVPANDRQIDELARRFEVPLRGKSRAQVSQALEAAVRRAAYATAPEEFDGLPSGTQRRAHNAMTARAGAVLGDR